MSSAGDPRFLVKICGITNEEDARFAIQAGANALGFNFYPRSPRYVTPARARQIAESVSASFLRVGVFVNAGVQELRSTAALVPLDVLQLHGEACALPPPEIGRVWRAINPAQTPDADAAIEAYLLDPAGASYGGSGHIFDWTLAANFPGRAIIAGGLDGANVAKAIEAAMPWGVDACSRLESSPGKKDPALVRAFVHAARAANQKLTQEIAL